MIYYQTKKCIRCNKPATSWTGYVEDQEGRVVLAGWCGKRCMRAWFSYRGRYEARMGKERM